MAGNRTRINCLEGSYAHHYTTDASGNNDELDKTGIIKYFVIPGITPTFIYHPFIRFLNQSFFKRFHASSA